MHIVGTPSRTVVPVSVIWASVAAGSNRGTIATAPPVISVATRPVDWPRTCENGAAPRTTSREPKPSASAAFLAAAAMLPCVSTAPLETPDVPEVKRMTAASEPARRTTGTSGPTASPSSAMLGDPASGRQRRELRGSLLVEDEGGRRDCVEPFVDLTPAQEDVDRDGHRPEPERAEIGRDEGGRVREHDRHPVPRRDARGTETRRRSSRLSAQLGVRAARTAVDQRSCSRIVARLADDACEILVHGRTNNVRLSDTMRRLFRQAIIPPHLRRFPQ